MTTPVRSPQPPRLGSKSVDLIHNATIVARMPRDLGGPRIGPYTLGKTLGVGSTGRVKLGTHYHTRQKVAIKIISKESLVRPGSGGSDGSGNDDDERQRKQNKLNDKTEREITIMKLIQHPNVLQLYDVYESDKELFLVLEHVEGGELFDYLVSKGRLPEGEALDFFQQITFGIDYCHRHLICHRDLKPENLLLDKSNTVKIADFGMANLQVMGKMLETSCGSPHYASPEIIKGIKYNGPSADVWSCGIILYALLTGNLPFDDDNIRKLLAKVKEGNFDIPEFVPLDAQDLIRKMLVVDPEERITMEEVFQHKWFTSAEPRQNALAYLSQPNRLGVGDEQHENFELLGLRYNDPDKLDLEIVSSLGFLGWTGNEKGLLQALLSPDDNIEKVFYNLLCRKKWDSFEDYSNQCLNVWDTSGTPKRRVGSISTQSGDITPLISRLDIYKSELELVRQFSSSNDSLIDDANITSPTSNASFDEPEAESSLQPKKLNSNTKGHSPLSQSIDLSDINDTESKTNQMKLLLGPDFSSSISTQTLADKQGTATIITEEIRPTVRRKQSLFKEDAKTPPVTPPKKRWFEKFNYTPPEITLISKHSFLETVDAAMLRLGDIHVKYQISKFGSCKCKYDNSKEPANTLSNLNIVSNFARKLSHSLKPNENSGTSSPISSSAASTVILSPAPSKGVKFRMEIESNLVSSNSEHCKIVFIHQQGSYALLQKLVDRFKDSWPLTS